MRKSEPTAAQARYRMRFSIHAVPDTAKKSVSKFNRMWLGKAMAFVAVFSMAFAPFIPVQAQAVPGNGNAQNNKIQICHKEDNGTYKQIEINVNGLNGHEGHEDDIIPMPQGGCPVVTPTPVDTTIVITGNTSAGENLPGWMFGRSVANATPFEFNFDKKSIGDGSLFVKPIGATAAHKFIGELFQKNLVSDVNSISFDYLMGPTAVANQFYMNVYVNYAGASDTKFFDCRYDVIASSGSTSSFNTLTFDPSLTYTVVTSGAPTVLGACPASPSGMGPGAFIRAFSLNLGDTSASDATMSGYFDKVVVDLNSGKTTYDFEPKTPTDVTILKVWQDASGEEIPAPSNKDDITISVETEENDDITCQYDDGELVCDDNIESFSGDTIKVTETGLPAGWSVVSSTVGNVTPVCVPNTDVNDKSLDCSHTVINKQNSAVVCGIEMVVNGGFELPEVTDAQKWQLFPSGTPGMGWSVDQANSDTNANMEIQEGVNGWNSHTGNQHAETDSDQSVKMYQDLITKVGGVYTVSLWTSPRPGENLVTNQTEVKMGGVVLGLISEDGTGLTQTVWTKKTYSFTATSTVSRLEITDKGASNSYGALIDDVSVIEDCISDVTICKVDQNQNPLSGWEVMLKGSKIETVIVNPNGNDYSTVATLEAGSYQLVAKGSYVYRNDPNADRSDAAYSKRLPSDSVYGGPYAPWVRVNDFPMPNTGWLGIQVDQANINWGNVFNPLHEYSAFKTLAVDDQLDFRILDDQYGDNTGFLTVDIYKVIKGTTGQNGCVTLQDVDYGSYKLDEIMKAGWQNVSGKGTTVVVDMPTETFTLVNKCTENCVSTVKICKEDNNGQDLSGWNVFLKGPRLEKLKVDSDEVVGTTSTKVLAAGQEYVIEISGEWQNRGFETVDASYTTPDGWTTVLAAPQGGYSDDLLETQINNAFVNWGPYSNNHEYSLVMTGTGSTANFRVYDMASGNPADMDPSWYGDNFGELEVEIFPIYQGVTGNDGCVFLQDVPFGTYTLGETMQEGWANVRGEGTTVIVNEPFEPGTNLNENPFILVNECIGTNCQTATVCEEVPISPISGAMTKFDGLKEGAAPLFLNSAASYPSGTTGTAVGVGPTGYAGAWDGAINDPIFSGSGAVFVSNHVTQPTFTGGAGFDGSVDSWRLFRHNFTIPAGATAITSPMLHFAADNEVTVFLNNVQIGFSASFNSVTSTGPLVLTPGTHTLEFAVKNYAFDQTNNPTGVIYKLDTVTYSCPSGGPNENPDDDVYGIVYEDIDESGNQDAGEPFLPNMTIKLLAVTDSDPGNEGTVLSEEEVATALSDENGYYEFVDVPEGCYIVREIPDGYVITEPSVADNNEYYIQVGDADCDFNGVDKMGLIESLFFKTAIAAVDTDNFIPYDASQSLDFGNFDISQGGNPGGGSGGSSGSGSNNNPGPQGQVAGDSTTTPSDTPHGQVAGATLPRTGMPTWALLMIALLAIPAFGLKAMAVKKANK